MIGKHMKHYPCDFCGSNEYSVLFQGKDLMEQLPGEFQMVSCNSCGLIRQNPRLEWVDLEKYYPPSHGSYKPLLPNSSSKIERVVSRYGHWKRVNLVYKYVPSGDWLEVGCGSGLILQEALYRNNWRLKAIEPNQQVAKYVQDNLNIPVMPIPFEEYTAKVESFDVITMWDVLEHLPDPANALKKVNRLLRNDGVFIFQIPNYESWNRNILKNVWNGYDLPRHLYLFPKKPLHKLLTDSGFCVIKQTCVAGSHGALMLDLAFWLRVNNSKIIEKIVAKGPEFIPFRLLTSIPLWITDKLRLSSNITIIAKKIVEN